MFTTIFWSVVLFCCIIFVAMKSYACLGIAFVYLKMRKFDQFNYWLNKGKEVNYNFHSNVFPENYR